MLDEEENDPYEITSLMERIRLGSLPIRPMDEKIKAQPAETETDTDATVSDVENKYDFCSSLLIAQIIQLFF